MKKPYKIKKLDGNVSEVVGDFDAYYKDVWSEKIKPSENSGIFKPEYKEMLKLDWEQVKKANEALSKMQVSNKPSTKIRDDEIE
jgi:hypothetical protein